MIRDVRYAARSLSRTPGLTAAALLCFAVGIAANTTVFSVTNAIVLHPVPTPNSRGLVMLAEVSPRPDPDDEEIAPANYLDLRRTSRTLASTAAFTGWDVNVTGIADPERVRGFRVTPDFFSVLGERPLLGRLFTDAESRTGAAPVVVLSEPLWRRRFGGDPTVIGRTVEINGATTTIVGVMRDDFMFPAGAELWGPLALDGAMAQERDGRLLNAIGRLRPGVSIDEARTEVRTIAKRLEVQYPAYNTKWSMRVEPANWFYARRSRPFVLMELGAVSFLLLIACANVANLLLARAATRGRELAIRVALGASRRELIRAQLAESGLLALVGGAIGVVLAVWGVVAVRHVLPSELLRFNPGWTRMSVDATTLVYSLGISVVTALLVGMMPAVVAARTDPQDVLRDGSRGNSAVGGRRLRTALVVAEVALALVNAVGTGLMVRNFQRLALTPPGYRVDHALTMTLTLPRARYQDDARVASTFRLIADRVHAVPGVTGVALTINLPGAWTDHQQNFYLAGHARPSLGEPTPAAHYSIVSPDYFATMEIPILRGRALSPTDQSATPHVAVVSEAMARRIWPGVDAIGKRFTILGDTAMTTVVGIARDVRVNPNVGPDPLAPTFYLPMAQAAYWRSVTLVARTTSDPAASAHDIQRAIGDVDRALAAGDVLTLQHVLDSSLAPQRISAGLLGIFSMIALLLAATGIYGVTSYTVARRTHEIGVRIALGAQYGDVVRHVVRGSLVPVVWGLGIGLAGALALSRVVGAIVHAISPMDPISFASGFAVLGAIALLGCLLPARRAARVDPIEALRAE